MNGITQFDTVSGAAAPITALQNAAFPNDDWFFDAVGAGGRADSGVTVSPMSALGHGPVWQAVNILAGDVGQLPLRKMRRKRRAGMASAQWETEKDDSHWTDYLFRDSPNEWMTPGMWKETMMSWALLWGNAICVIDQPRTDNARLIPLLPDRTWHEHLGLGQYAIYTRLEESGRTQVFDYRDCFHIRGLATDGFWGLSAVQVAKNVIGHGLALQRHGDSCFRNAARPSGYLRKPEGVLSPEARANLRKEWEAVHAGTANAGRIAVLWEGMEFHQMSMSNEDAQWLEGRKLDREFIASLFNLPAFKLNAMENSAVRANLEEQNRDYFNTSLSRWTLKFAEEAARKLLTEKERRSNKHFYKWFPEAFLRGDTQARFAAYSLAITNQWMSPNEVRQLEDMNPYDGGDEFRNPAINVAPAADPPPAAPEQPAEDDAIEESAAALIRSQVGAVLAGEARRLTQEAGRARNYTAWVAGYYEDYQDRVVPLLAPACDLAAKLLPGVDWQAAYGEHARNCVAELLDLLSLVTRDELRTAIHDYAVKLTNKTDALTRRILGHE